MKTETRTLKTIERLNSSVNGNPRYAFTFGNGNRAILSSDAAVGYEIGNPGYREGDTVEVTFTRAGRVATMEATDPRTLTHDDRVVIYQLEKIDQGGDIQDQFEEQAYALADRLDLEIDDTEGSPGEGCLMLGEGRWATLSMTATVFDEQGDLEARVFIATSHYRIPEVPEELELEDTTVIGVYSSEESAWQALAEAAAEEWDEYLADEEGADQAAEYMGERRYAVNAQAVLS